MVKNKPMYSKKEAGFGLIIGTAIGASIEFISGRFTGIISAAGAGLGLCMGALLGCLSGKKAKKS